MSIIVITFIICYRNKEKANRIRNEPSIDTVCKMRKLFIYFYDTLCNVNEIICSGRNVLKISYYYTFVGALLGVTDLLILCQRAEVLGPMEFWRWPEANPLLERKKYCTTKNIVSFLYLDSDSNYWVIVNNDKNSSSNIFRDLFYLLKISKCLTRFWRNYLLIRRRLLDQREMKNQDHNRVLVNFSGNPIEKGGIHTSKLFKEESFKEFMFGEKTDFNCLTMKYVDLDIHYF